MRTKLTDAALYAALVLTVAVIALATSAANATIADAYTLGAADGTTEAAPIAARLGARTYRVVMDPNVPLDAYAPRIQAYRAMGMRPQIAIGGTGTTTRGRTRNGTVDWRAVNYAVHAAHRWPDAYSVSVVNEPDLSGISVCGYYNTYRTAYRMLKRAGVKRVLFGEFSPASPLGWTAAVLDRCAKSDVIADGWAWHCYDSFASWFGIGNTRDARKYLSQNRGRIHTRKGNTLPLYCTEYGSLVRFNGGTTPEDVGADQWRRALAITRKYDVKEIVAWGITESPSGSVWDSSLVRCDGTLRPAFAVVARAQ